LLAAFDRALALDVAGEVIERFAAAAGALHLAADEQQLVAAVTEAERLLGAPEAGRAL
jgi:hypothetical protein